jgi:chromosome segregation ATPase
MQPNGDGATAQLAARLTELEAGHLALARRVALLDDTIARLEDELRDYRAALAEATRQRRQS